MTAARLVPLVLLSPAACTLLSNFSVHQCDTNADCETQVGLIAHCEESRCIDGCQDNHHCASFDPRKPICAATGDQCRSLTSDDGSCFASSTYDDATMGTLTGEDMAILGAFAPTLESSTWLTLELAAGELNAATSLAPGVIVPTLVVLCHGDSRSVVDSMEHLVDALHVEAIVASTDELSLRAIQANPGLEGQPLLLSPSAALSAPDSSALLWYLGGNYEDVAQAYPPLIRRANAIVQSMPGAAGIRIASLVDDALEDITLAEAIAAQLEIDGRDADYLFREDRFRAFTLPDDAETRAAALDELAAFEPNVILVFAGDEPPEAPEQPRLVALETLEAHTAAAIRRPVYILGPRAAEDRAVRQLAATSESFRARAVALSVDRPMDLARASALSARFGTLYPDAAARSLDAAPNTYDAVYYLNYALSMARQGSRSSSVAGTVDGLARVVEPGGAEIPVGPDGISFAVEQVAARAPFELQGTTGPARFTPRRARGGQVELFCWTSDATDPSPAAARRRYDPRTLTALDPSLEPECAQELLGPELEP